jgi:hypothetical protein
MLHRFALPRPGGRLGRILAFVLVIAPIVVGVSTQAGRAVSATPPVTAGLQLWYEADSATDSDGAAVTRWPDKSGLGRDLTASDSGAAAVMRRGTLNGRAALEFNGSNSLMKTYGSTFTIAQPDNFFIVYKSLDANTPGRAFAFDSRNSSVRQVFGKSAAGTERLYANNDLDFSGITYPFSQFEILNGTFNGTQSDLYRNGSIVGTGNAGGSGLEGFTVGALSTSSIWGYDYGHFLVAEILVYSGTMTAANRQSVTSWLNEKYNVTAPPAPPSNTAAPAVTGTTVDGSTLTASTGSWAGSSPFTFTAQWQRCAPTCTNISGATSLTYVLTSADVGSTLQAKVTATNSVGSATATSAQTGSVSARAPSATSPPIITGTARDTSTLSATTGVWTGTSPLSYAYQWQRCDGTGASCLPIASATSSAYTLTSTDVGATVRVQVTATNAAGSVASVSAQSLQVASAAGGGSQPPVATGLQLWFDASTVPGGDGTAVTRWPDGSGNGRDLTAFDPSQAAALRLNAVNGKPALEFNGSNSLFKTYGSTFTIAQPDTFFIVYKSLDTTPGVAVFDSMSSSARQLLGVGSANNQTEMYADIVLQATSTYPFPNYQIWGGTYNGTSSSLWRNGAQVAAGSAGNAALSGFTVGALSTSAQYGYSYSHSLIAEILVYSGSMSATNRQATTDWLNSKYNVLAPVVAPSSTVAPAITGTATDGSTLTASTGTWAGTSPFNFAYQWRRCASGGTCTNIAGATQATYIVTSADIGSTIVAQVTASNSAGSASASSPATAVVAAAAPQNTALPAISGTAQDTKTLNATNGTWSGTGPFNYTYQWQRCDNSGNGCAPISGATTAVYVATTTDVGSTLRASVTASNTVGSASAVSAQTSVVLGASVPPPPGSPPITSGLQLWFSSATLTGADGSAVTQWTDGSGNGRNLTSFDPSQSATLRVNAVNGQPALEFDGSTSLMKTYGSTFTIAQPDTYFIVYKSLDVAGGNHEAYIFDSTSSAVRQLLGLGPFGNTEMYADIDIEGPTPYPFPSYQIWSGTYQGSSSTLWKNGAKIATAPAGNSGLSGFTVGALSTSAQYGYLYSHSLVAEILLYSGSMTDADRATVTSWLNTKYGLF